MKTSTRQEDSLSLAVPVAAEDLHCGDYVAVLQERYEVPSFLWDCSGLSEAAMVKMSCIPCRPHPPQRVEAICLPFVFVRDPRGRHRTLDIRKTQLARLDRGYAKTVWKALKRKRAKQKQPGELKP